MILGRYGLREPSEQGHGGGYVLACSGEVREAIIVFDYPSVHVASPGVCTPVVRMMSDFMLDFYALLL
jgi:hypothetical protein